MIKARSLLKLSVELIALIILFFWLFVPLTSLVLWSIALKWYGPSLFPQEIGLDYWLQALGITRGIAITTAVSIVDALKTSVIIALIVLILAQLISLPASYVLARYRIPYKPILFFLLLMPQAFPLQPVYIALLKIFYQIGLAGTIPGVVIAHLIPSLVFAVWINTATFRSIPPEMEEAARVAGASPLRTFFSITLPLASPGILASSVFVFLYSLDEFTGTLFIGLPNVVTLPLLLYSSSGYSTQFASAVAIVLAIPGLLFMLILERFLRAEYLALARTA